MPRISVKSAKAKGRNLQNLVAAAILCKYPVLDGNDVRGAIMGENGEDIKLSNHARQLFPYSVECKARAAFSTYSLMEQAVGNCEGREPLLIIKGDRKKPLVIIDLDKFMELL